MKLSHRLNLRGGAAARQSPGAYRTTIGAAPRYLLITYCIFALTACGGGGDGSNPEVIGPPPPVNLSFALNQVNGQNLPATFQTPDGLLVINLGSMQMKPDRTFSESITYNFTVPGGSAVLDTAITAGGYAQTGESIVFSVPASGGEAAYTFEGTLVGTTLTYNDNGFVAVYKR